MESQRESIVGTYVDVQKAQKTRVIHLPGAVTSEDIAQILKIQSDVDKVEDKLENNPQNAQHENKRCTFINRPPTDPLRTHAPRVLGKVLRAGLSACEQAGWSRSDLDGTDDCGILKGIDFRTLKIRNVECWAYDVGGKLDNDFHFDAGSIITIVTLLNNDFEGGVFRTFEVDGTHLEHPMVAGDIVCFVSHKYHNVTEVTRGLRRSMVIELWEGGLPLFLR